MALSKHPKGILKDLPSRSFLGEEAKPIFHHLNNEEFRISLLTESK